MDSRTQYLIPAVVSNKNIVYNAVDAEIVSHPFASYILLKYNINKKFSFLRHEILKEKNFFNFSIKDGLIVAKFKIPQEEYLNSKLPILFGEKAFTKSGLLNAMKFWCKKKVDYASSLPLFFFTSKILYKFYN